MRARFPRGGATRSALLAGAIVLTAACSDLLSSGPVRAGRVRFVNLLAEGQTVDAFLDAEPFGKRLPFGASSPLWLPPPLTANYQNVSWGGHVLSIVLSSDTTVVLGQFTFSVDPPPPPDSAALSRVPSSPAPAVVPDGFMFDRTIYATGGGGFDAFQTFDDNSEPEPGTIRVRVVNVSQSGGPVDVFVTSQTADLTLATPAATNIGAFSASEYFSVTPGTWRVRVVLAGVPPAQRTAQLLFNLSDQTWERGGRTIAIADLAVFNLGYRPRAVILTDQ